MTDFFNSIFAWFDSLNWSEWTLLILGALFAASLIFSGEDKKLLDANGVPVVEDDYPANGSDTITCTVPGQPVIVLRPNEFSSFDEAYTGIWEVTLRNGNCILLPMQYTTILDNSMDISTL